MWIKVHFEQTRCSRGCSTNSFVIQSGAFSSRSSKHHNSQTVRAREQCRTAKRLGIGPGCGITLQKMSARGLPRPINNKLINCAILRFLVFFLSLETPFMGVYQDAFLWTIIFLYSHHCNLYFVFCILRYKCNH